ncbi:dihydropteroate synthase [Sulfurimonas sp. HSL3-7]|uniref:dihydropteroate synthase n=1 Tax=Sulfonitrofixus jiaomeiensis TaxID=3131938 RepID=UPI0031F80439
MVIEQLSTDINIIDCLKKLGVDGGGVSIMASKAQIYLISIKALHVGAANILKQDALSIGADLAVPKGTVTASEKHVDTLLIATKKQLQLLSRKELAQPFGLKDLARQLQMILKAKKPDHCAVMGVLNANDDSFYAQSRFNAAEALQRIERMIDDGAEIIDIGGVSSRPGSEAVSAEEELARVKPVIDLLDGSALLEKARFSIDTYEPIVARYALERGFHIINDITGLENDALCEVIAEFGAQAVIMHMQGTPKTMQKNPQYDDLLDEIYRFFEARIAKAERFGIDDIVLDVGIGFGKSLQDNLKLITNLEHFLRLNRPLLVGASRKGMIDKIDPSAVSERLGGTLALHLAAAKNGAAIVRVHDVQEHAQALKVQKALIV